LGLETVLQETGPTSGGLAATVGVALAIGVLLAVTAREEPPVATGD
jgi:hypothetical protein